MDTYTIKNASKNVRGLKDSTLTFFLQKIGRIMNLSYDQVLSDFLSMEISSESQSHWMADYLSYKVKADEIAQTVASMAIGHDEKSKFASDWKPWKSTESSNDLPDQTSAVVVERIPMPLRAQIIEEPKVENKVSYENGAVHPASNSEELSNDSENSYLKSLEIGFKAERQEESVQESSSTSTDSSREELQVSPLEEREAAVGHFQELELKDETHLTAERDMPWKKKVAALRAILKASSLPVQLGKIEEEVSPVKPASRRNIGAVKETVRLCIAALVLNPKKRFYVLSAMTNNSNGKRTVQGLAYALCIGRLYKDFDKTEAQQKARQELIFAAADAIKQELTDNPL